MALLHQQINRHFQRHPLKSRTTKAGKGKKGSNVKKPPHNPKYNELQRLLTFSSYSRDFPCSPILLARNGFIYAGNGSADDDTVMCVFCFSVGYNVHILHTNDDIKNFHRELNPDCRIVKGLGCGNRLIAESEEGAFEAILHQLYKSRRRENENATSAPAHDRGPVSDGPNTLTEVDSSGVQNLPPENLEPQSSNVSVPSRHLSRPDYSLQQQAAEVGVSSQMITNHAGSLNHPWQNTISEPVSTLVNTVNVGSSSATAGSSDDGARPDGASFSLPNAHAATAGSSGDGARPDGASFLHPNAHTATAGSSGDGARPDSTSFSHPNAHTAIAGSSGDGARPDSASFSHPNAHTATAGSSGDGARPDSASFSHPNALTHTSSNTSSTSNRNSNNGNQRDRPDATRPHNQNTVSPDAMRTARDSVNASPTRNTSTPANSSQQSLPPPPQNSSSSQQDENVPDGATSYDKLGIFTARPKRPEYAVEQIRLQSFEGWPSDHHIRPEMLAKAGYFYTGYSDCARCFYCGGGLRNWEEGDDVWVEHARWFPKCTFIRQNMGQVFIDVVQDLSKEQEIIPYRDVITRMEARGLEIEVPRDMEDKTQELKKDVAVRTTLDNGFTMTDTIRAAEKVREMGYSLTSDLIFEELVKMNARKIAPRVPKDTESESLSTRGKENVSQGTMDSLISENNELRQQSLCKICLDKEVAVVFLPCGHFVSCSDCSYALKACPICRQVIKGVVKGCLS